jgi:hypothetical protein
MALLLVPQQGHTEEGAIMKGVVISICLLGLCVFLSLCYTNERAKYDQTLGENSALQGRIAVLQKRTEEMQKRINKQERDQRLAANLAKFDRGILINQRDACEAKVEAWVRGACSEVCLRSYTTLTGMQQILADGAIELEALRQKHQREREARQMGAEGRRAIDKIEAGMEKKP